MHFFLMRTAELVLSLLEHSLGLLPKELYSVGIWKKTVTLPVLQQSNSKHYLIYGYYL